MGALLTRNVFWLVDSFPIAYALPACSQLWSPGNHVRIGDLAAGTLLVYARNDTTTDSLPGRAPRSLLTTSSTPAPLESAERAVATLAHTLDVQHTRAAGDRRNTRSVRYVHGDVSSDEHLRMQLERLWPAGGAPDERVGTRGRMHCDPDSYLRHS